MSISVYPASLSLNQLRLMVHLGHGEEERNTVQPIHISVTLYLSNLPHACAEDGAGFFCYQELADLLKQVVEHQRFALIEYLAMRMCAVTENWLDEKMQEVGVEDVRYRLQLDKVEAPVPELQNGSSFVYTNLPTGLTA
jgi:FolB domain-containing protein